MNSIKPDCYFWNGKKFCAHYGRLFNSHVEAYNLFKWLEALERSATPEDK